jgi:DMSO/TMAO reductase YedYZ molybdopterin-dependent catalytic subunit
MVGLVLAFVVLAGCGGAPKVDWTVTINGGSTPYTITYAELVKKPQVDLKDILMQKSMGEDEVVSWSGVALDGLLEEAGITSVSGVTATAADGYAIEISADELKGAIIALKRGGEWITKAEPDKGPVRLVCPETPANRWVFQIQEITVKP